jgi:hypothetical protein
MTQLALVLILLVVACSSSSSDGATVDATCVQVCEKSRQCEPPKPGSTPKPCADDCHGGVSKACSDCVLGKACAQQGDCQGLCN